jgi:hypothetical protein
MALGVCTSFFGFVSIASHARNSGQHCEINDIIKNTTIDETH